ncbi:hypothetical protein [Pseudofrankia sp. DC12]|uniref:hypothetical protein n=1 Tax=Pseudofrankia sp. DC12 TaxID=683315 RepID=UPI001E4E8993|nr:hypothetical protein [Pseudofrankia sp. DC12]
MRPRAAIAAAVRPAAVNAAAVQPKADPTTAKPRAVMAAVVATETTATAVGQPGTVKVAGVRPTAVSARATAAPREGAASRRELAAAAGFDRLRPRAGRPAGPGTGSTAHRPGSIGRDTHGKRALYSGERPPDPRTNGVMVHCSRCAQATTVGAKRALLLLAPSLHLPVIRPRYPSLLRCPACHRISWVRLALTGAGG